MPVPQTLTSGALGLATKWSASSMHTFRLMSSLFFTKAPDAPHRREARNKAEFMFEERLTSQFLELVFC